MLNKKRLQVKNRAITESADVILQALINEQPITENFLTQTFSASLSKHGLTTETHFDLIGLLNGCILHLHQQTFLTPDQKARYNNQLDTAIRELQNPFGKVHFELDALLEKTKALKENLNREEGVVDTGVLTGLVEGLEEKIKGVKLRQTDTPPAKDHYVFRGMFNLVSFSLKTAFYGIAFNGILFVSLLVYQYIQDPEPFNRAFASWFR